MKTEIFENYTAFLARPDKTVNGVSKEFAETHEGWAEERSNKGSWNCSGCSDINGIGKAAFEVPAIPNIHQSIRDAVKQEGALNMKDWHTCNTTHCRGGWVVVLAGEAGKKLEKATSTIFAAMQIYKASSTIRVSPARFFDTNEEAMADIERCEGEEASKPA